MNNIGIIILSNGKNQDLRFLTQQTILSLINSENSDLKFEIVVIESHREMKPYQYKHTKTIYPETSFGFNKYLNIGLSHIKTELVCFCNNDLLFEKNWGRNMIDTVSANPDVSCFSSFCPVFHKNKEITNNITYGFANGIDFTGWCFLVRKKLFETTGNFDEKFNFWYADDDFRLTLQKHGLKNVLIKNAIVEHLGSMTLSNTNKLKKNKLQFRCFAYYKFKWFHHKRTTYMIDTFKYEIKIILDSLKGIN